MGYCSSMKVAIAGDYSLPTTRMNLDMVITHPRGEVRAKVTGTTASPPQSTTGGRSGATSCWSATACSCRATATGPSSRALAQPPISATAATIHLELS